MHMYTPKRNHQKPGPKVRWPVELCEEAIRRYTQYCEENDQLPTRNGYQKWQKDHSDAPSINPIERLGAWNRMRLQASSNPEIEAQNLLHQRQVYWTAEKCLFALLLYKEQAGEAATESGYIRWRKGKKNLPTSTTIAYRFGSWKLAWKKVLDVENRTDTPANSPYTPPRNVI